MKKRDNLENVYSKKDLEHLERKYEEEKMIIVKENKKLQTQIYGEIEESNFNKIKYEKYKQVSEKKIEQLQIEVERLKGERMIKNDEDSDEEDSEEALELLKANRDLIKENAELKMKVQEFMNLILNMEKENEDKKYEVEQTVILIREKDREIEELKEYNSELLENGEVLTKESKKTRKQLEQKDKQIIHLRQENQSCEEKLKMTRKKNKQIQATLGTLEKRMSNFQLVKSNQLEIEINQLKKLRQEQDQEKMTLNRRIDFLEVELKQKNSCIQALNKEVYQLKETLIQRENQLQQKIQLQENENRRSIIQIENLKTKIMRQSEEFQKNTENEIANIRKKVAQEIYSFVKSNQTSPQNIETYMEGLRGCKSQNQLRMKAHDEKKHVSFQKFKYENQINGLEGELGALKKQIQSLNQQLIRLTKMNQEKKEEIQEKEKKIKQLVLVNERTEHQKIVEAQKLRNELSYLKEKETQVLQMKKNQTQIQMAINQKILFYEDKIRQKIDTIARKDNTIENLKEKRMELENKAKFLQDKLAKVLEDLENNKRLKADCQRKDELMKDYKQRMEKAKSQLEHSKTQIQKLKKQKARLDKNLQSKEEYIAILKSKVAKEQEEQQSKGREEKQIKQMKQKYEGKLRKFKKDYESIGLTLENIRQIIFQCIKDCLEKSKIETLKKDHNWEAAKMLGLQADEIEQFVNPTVNLDKHICEDLVRLWEKGEYENFMRSSLQYITLKNQSE